jgi:hypothetical protein
MEISYGRKRANATLDLSSLKRRKTNNDGSEDETLHNYEPPERAHRTGGFPKAGSKLTPSCAALNDLALPRSTYQYRPIINNGSEIRLAILDSGIDDETIKCNLKTFKLSEAPKYEALSYVWGSEPADHELKVGDESLYITRNLCKALRRTRSRTNPTVLWIDALCINQDDNDEKSGQIKMMSKIYQEAHDVLVWLGEEELDSDAAMEFVSHLLDPRFLSEDNWPSTYARGFYALAHLLERPWFSRVWVLQEVAYAKDVVIKCGQREVHFMDFMDACNIVKSKLSSIRHRLRNTPLYDSHGHLLHNFEDSGATRLFDLLRNAFVRSSNNEVISRRLSLESLVCDLAPFQATDPRDSIFALLGLAKDADTLPFNMQPDYCKSVLDVYSQFTTACAKASGSLDIICRPWAPRKKTTWQDDLVDPDLRFQVPSWIPVRGDLPFGDPKYNSKRRIHGDILVGSAKKAIYNAHNKTPAQVRFGVDDMTKTSNGSMHAKGIILCTLDALSTRMPDGVVLKECLDMVRGIARDENDNIIGLDDSLWRTLCANRDNNGEQPPSIYRIAALHLLQTNHHARSIDTTEILEAGAKEYQEEFLKRVQAVTWNRRIFRAGERNTTNDLIGLVPRGARSTDHVCILFGLSVPVVLREHEIDGRSCWELIGEAYVDGRMDGEALCSLNKEEIASRRIEFEIR